jgi:inorganic pyrophosphatase
VEIQEFFETYKRLEPHKWVKVKEWKNAQQTQEIIQYAMTKFRESWGNVTENHK